MCPPDASLIATRDWSDLQKRPIRVETATIARRKLKCKAELHTEPSERALKVTWRCVTA